MTPITTTDELAALCQRLAKEPFVAIDTEFMRESTYWPRLCLIQLAGKNEAATIDALAESIELGPLFSLLASNTIKVFHSARQDIEIFYNLDHMIPTPLFDTQVAAMVCGFGDSVGYDRLVYEVLKKRIDKTSQFTDWARRPLTNKQLKYALNDVVHLYRIYSELYQRVTNSRRNDWLDEEMATLTNPATYSFHPMEAWLRIKTRNSNRRFLGILQEVAAWREKEAQRLDKPRNWLMKDEALIEIANHPPRDITDLTHIRALPRSFGMGNRPTALLAAVKAGLEKSESDLPVARKSIRLPSNLTPLVELLKVLLKMKCESFGVAQKLVASTKDLERIALDDHASVAALSGWRHELFGRDALALKHNQIALSVKGNQVQLIPLNERDSIHLTDDGRR